MKTAPTPIASTTEWLVCVYYRVARADSAHAMRAVREFQRTLRDRFGDLEPQVLLRCELPPADPSPHVPPFPSSPDPTSAVPAHVEPGMEDTLMETYRLARPDAGDDAVEQAALRAFLDALDAHATQSLSSVLRGTRHVELFAPCAS